MMPDIIWPPLGSSEPVVVPLRLPDLKTRIAACAAGSLGLSARF